MIAAADNAAKAIALRMTGISKRFGPVQALQDVTFTVRKGTVHALVGENGAGKSTLMKVLAGVHKPDSGELEIHGKKYTFEKPQQALDAGVSMIYQDLDLAEELTVAENIFLGNEPRGMFPFMVNHKEMAKKTRALSSQYHFDVRPDAVVSDLPTGQCQVVEIIKALARNASIIVMDEPTSSLSEAEAAKLFEDVRNLRSMGFSIIYISHRLEEVVDLADDITVLRDGKVVHCEQAAKLDIPQIVHHMIGRELKEFYPSRQVEIGPVCIEVKNLQSSKTKEPVTFQICRGEIVGMAGLVGAGRTEIAEAIFGVDKNASGEILLDDQKIKINSPGDAIRNGIALLTEDRKRTGLCLNLPCGWNVTLASLEQIGMKYLIRPGKERQIAAEYASKMAVKWSSSEAPASSLSGGNQQKLLIARWLLAESKFMIFDEPTRGIDVGAKKDVYELLNALAARGKAILFISSELPELFGITDRILVMRRGKLVGNLVTNKTNEDQVMHLAAVED